MYNYNHLYYFYVTAKAGGVTSASTHLRISQPSLSSQLKVLEQALELKLFQKAGRTIELTHSGAEVFSYCRQMFEFSEKMTEAISKKVPTATRKMCIGVSDQLDKDFVSNVVNHFLKKFDQDKRPKITVISATVNQLSDKLKFKEFDAVLSDSPVNDPLFHDLDNIDIPVVLTSSKDFDCIVDDRVENRDQMIERLTQSKTINWIVPSVKFKFRSDIDRFLESNKVKSKIAFESDSMSTLVHAVEEEIGVAFFPLIYVSSYLKDNALKLIGPGQGLWNYKLSLHCHTQNKEDHLVQSLSDSFKSITNKNLVSA